MIVVKFGGTSVGNAERIQNLCHIIKKQIDKKPIVVVSAVGGVTDLLLAAASERSYTKHVKSVRAIHIQIARQLFRDKDLLAEVFAYIDEKIAQLEVHLALPHRHSERSEESKKRSFANTQDENSEKQKHNAWRDVAVSFGEILSSYIVTKALDLNGVHAIQVIATDLIVTSDKFGSADFIPIPTEAKCKKKLMQIIKSSFTPVVTGFIGATKGGELTTLGRGGSDYSASIIGYCLKAAEIQIWTDVDGIYTSDPKIVSRPKLLRQISYHEASELAAFGAKVLHPRTIRPAVKAKIPLKILNSFNPKNPGTLVCEKPDFANPITAIAYKKSVTLVNIYSTKMLFSRGFLAKIFETFAKNNISVDLVSVSEVSVSVTLDAVEGLEKAVEQLSGFASVSVKKNLGMVSIIGEGIVTSTKTIRSIFEILDREKILVTMVSLGATDINVSLVIQYDLVQTAVRALHNRLLLKNMQRGDRK